jgi:hypothetical protein
VRPFYGVREYDCAFGHGRFDDERIFFEFEQKALLAREDRDLGR